MYVNILFVVYYHTSLPFLNEIQLERYETKYIKRN